MSIYYLEIDPFKSNIANWIILNPELNLMDAFDHNMYYSYVKKIIIIEGSNQDCNSLFIILDTSVHVKTNTKIFKLNNKFNFSMHA